MPSPVLASTVLDTEGRTSRSSPGTPGEAVYRSPSMMSGYYRDEAATREAFRFGWFHSGDSCVYDDDGLRVMLDRYKDIVKTGGENVSSLRVEAVLSLHPGVAKSAVIGLPHPHWGEAVTAVVVRAPGRHHDRGRAHRALPRGAGRVRDTQVRGVRRRPARDRGRQGAQVPAARPPTPPTTTAPKPSADPSRGLAAAGVAQASPGPGRPGCTGS